MFLTSMQISREAREEVNIDQLQSLCGQCNMFKDCKTKKMKFSGDGKRGILIIGDKPSEADDNNAIQFSGESGTYLKEILSKNKISMNRDCWKVNIIRCAGAKIAPMDVKLGGYAKTCSGYTLKLIYELKPKHILILGDAAITALFGDDFSNREIERWRGFHFYDQKFQTTFFATFHPRDVQIGKFDIAKKTTFERDIQQFVRGLSINRENNTDFEKFVTPLTTYNEVNSLLDKILYNKPRIYTDLETSGLKPYRPGHFIASVGIALSKTEGYAFPFKFNNFWKDSHLKSIQEKLTQIIMDRGIHKIAHNAKFEDSWFTHILGVHVNGWRWDTMVAAHILDNRAEFSGLKFQSFINFGLRPYDKFIDEFIHSKTEFNRVSEAPLPELLTYNGMDCVLGYQLYERQMQEFAGKRGLANANSFLFRGTLSMSRFQRNGIDMDEEHYSNQRTKMTLEINRIYRELTKGPEAKLFKEKFHRDIKISSNPDLGKLFFEVLEYPPVYTGRKNAKGEQNYKTDINTLSRLNIPFVGKLLNMKRLVKARDTYLAQFSREVFAGKMYPFFDLHVPATYRSSSSKPNFQNLPKRNEEIKIAVRSGIVPGDPSYVLSETDFSGAEVITSASYHKDPTFISYLLDKSTDMHRDQALDLWQLDQSMLVNESFTREQKGLAKKIRFYAKNNWTFAQFYGDWYDSCAKNLWENCIVREKLVLPNGVLLLDHCSSMGIYTVEDFIEHCKEVEHRLWNERFPIYTRWKQNIFKFYLKYGYIETYYGFKFTGYMDKKQCCNYPIQGTSFHNLLNVIFDVEKFIHKNKMDTKIVGQIHDSIIAKIPKDEIEFYHKGVSDIIATLHERLSWLVVPMEAECSISKLGKDGGNMSKLYEIKPKFLNGTERFNLDLIYA